MWRVTVQQGDLLAYEPSNISDPWQFQTQQCYFTSIFGQIPRSKSLEANYMCNMTPKYNIFFSTFNTLNSWTGSSQIRYLDDSSTNNSLSKLISNPPLKRQWFPGIRGGILQNVWKSKAYILFWLEENLTLW